MADHVTFRGAKIRYFDGRRKEGNCFVRIHMTAEVTQPVLEAMNWTDPGPSASETKMSGQLVGTHIILTPNDKKLRGHELSLDVNGITSFKLVRTEEDDKVKRELRFVVRSPVLGGVSLVENYVNQVGDCEGAMKVTYSKQEDLPLGAETGEGASTGEVDNGCVSCANDIEFVDDKKRKHVNGVKCTRKVTQINLPAG